MAAGSGGKDRIVGAAAVGARLVGREFVAQEGEQDDLPQAGRGLGAADSDAAIGQVDVAPAQVAQLARARPGEQQRGDDRPAVVRQPALVAVELAGRLQQRRDLLDSVAR